MIFEILIAGALLLLVRTLREALGNEMWEVTCTYAVPQETAQVLWEKYEWADTWPSNAQLPWLVLILPFFGVSLESTLRLFVGTTILLGLVLQIRSQLFLRAVVRWDSAGRLPVADGEVTDFPEGEDEP